MPDQPVSPASQRVSWFERDPGGGTIYVRPCTCETAPMTSGCGTWEGNQSACVCAANAVESLGPPLPS